MSNALAVQQPQELITFNDNQLRLIKNVIAKNATNDELDLFLAQCKRTGLDPFSRQIYFVKYGNQMSIITAIDGYRAIADRTGKYAGSDDADIEYKDDNVYKATVTVYKLVGGQRCPFTASALFSEYSTGKNKWKDMPVTMIAKCAEALALRKAFPQQLSGVYTQEEMDQAGKPSYEMPEVPTNTTVIDASPEPPQETKPKAKPKAEHKDPEPEEIYEGLDHQRLALANMLKANGITDKEKQIEIARAMSGKKWAESHVMVADALGVPF